MARRIVIGDLGSGQWGARISKPGVDALTGDRSQMMFDADLPNTRVIMTGSLSTAFSSSNSRSRVGNQIVQLPPIDYEPIVFCGFINRVKAMAVGGVSDPLAGQHFGSCWFSGQTNANPVDYAEWTWDPLMYRLTFNAECLNDWWPFGGAGSQPMRFRYIVFSSRGG